MSDNKTILYIAMSLDGYIARLDGSVDWLFDVEGDGGDNGYAAFYETIGSVVMGRYTYEEVLTLSEEFPYADRPTYVLSRSEQPPAPHVQFTTEEVDTLIPQLKQTSDGDVWIVGGGILVQAVLAKNYWMRSKSPSFPRFLVKAFLYSRQALCQVNLKCSEPRRWDRSFRFVMRYRTAAQRIQLRMSR